MGLVGQFANRITAISNVLLREGRLMSNDPEGLYRLGTDQLVQYAEELEGEVDDLRNQVDDLEFDYQELERFYDAALGGAKRWKQLYEEAVKVAS